MLIDEKHKSEIGYSNKDTLQLRGIDDRMLYYKDYYSRVVLKKMLEEDGRLVPHYDPKTGGFVYSDLNPSVVKDVIVKLVKGGLVRIVSLNNAAVCPYHGETAFHVLLKCRKHNAPLERKELWEHVPCGYLASSDNFKKVEDKLICPRCQHEIKAGEIKRLGVWFSCTVGKENVPDPEIILHCIIGNHEIPIVEANLIERAEYQINPVLADEIKHVLSFYDKVGDILYEKGYVIDLPVLKGASGINHTFDLVAKKNGKNIFTLEAFFSEREIPEASIISFLTKVYDTRPEKAAIVAVPSLSAMAVNMLDGLGIRVLVSPTIHEAKERLSEISEFLG